MNEHIVVVGAGSGIAQALCHVLGARKCGLILSGRNADELSAFAADLRIRYETTVAVEVLDALQFDSHAGFVERCRQHCEGRIDGVVLCYGHLPEPGEAGASPDAIRQSIDVNFTSQVLLLELFATVLESQRGGYLAAISSVAGDRGRQSNYVYGASKGALSTYLQGLRNRLWRSGVHVATIKPGFVDTAMTRGRINPRSPLVASPERVARDIDSALRRHKNVIYTPWFWWPIMKIIALIPEPVFERMRL